MDVPHIPPHSHHFLPPVICGLARGNMNNPFYETNARSLTLEAILSMRVDRDTELSQCIQAVVNKRNNVLIYGDRGVGKTFLLRLIQKELNKNDEVFAAFVETSALCSFGTEDPVASFSRLLLLQFCTCIWKDILGKSYLDLRETLDEEKQDITLRNITEKTTQRVYAHLMTHQRQAQHQIFNTIGFSAGVKGEKKEQISHQKQQADVLPFEFVEFAQELSKNVLLPKGKKRTIILCDEANLLPSFFQEEILERYFGLFCAQQFQFVFVAGLLPWHDRSMPDCFETTIELNGFTAISDLQGFISRVNTTDISIHEDSISLLHERFKGHPRHSLGVCWRAYELAQDQQESEISVDHMQQACDTYEALLIKRETEFRQNEI